MSQLRGNSGGILENRTFRKSVNQYLEYVGKSKIKIAGIHICDAPLEKVPKGEKANLSGEPKNG